MIQISSADRQRLAASMSLNEQYLYQCATDRRAWPVDRCTDIERAADRLGIAGMTRRDLRPDDWWRIWPELITPDHPAPAEPKAA